MTRATMVGLAFAVMVVGVAMWVGHWYFVQGVERVEGPAAVGGPAVGGAPAGAGEGQEGFLSGRVTTDAGATFEGRLRWGGDQEAFWGDYFNGVEQENPWVARAPEGELPTEDRPVEILGIEVLQREGAVDVGRLFMARFGDIAHIEGEGTDVRVTLKSGTVFELARLDASDFDDGVRVWDAAQGVVDIAPRRIRSIELRPVGALGDLPQRLHGTVRTRQGDFAGFMQWNRKGSLGSDTLDGRTAEGHVSFPFDLIRAIERRGDDSSLVTLADGRELELSGTSDVGAGHRGIYLDDARFGRVLISWDAFERVDFSPGGSGPGYADFPPGHPLAGEVTTRSGRRLAGRVVYDFDESETTDTLEAPSEGVDYTIPFGLVASIELPAGTEDGERRATVTLHDGTELRLERDGDLADDNVGLLVVGDGRRAEYLPWSDVLRIDLERPPAMYPPIGEPQTGR